MWQVDVNDVSREHDVTTVDGLTAFYEVSFEEVYRSAARLTRGDRAAAEDLVHDAFVRLTRAARAGDVTVVGIGWLVTTVRRLHIDRVRSAGREDHRLRLTARRDTTPVEQHGGWSSVLDGLRDRERVALMLRYVEDLPVSEVAELLGTTVRATESLLQRAKRKVRTARSVS